MSQVLVGEEKRPWLFTHQEACKNGSSAVSLLLREKPSGEHVAVFLVEKRPALGGVKTLMLPGGNIDATHGNHAHVTAKQEIAEESGDKVDHVKPLHHAPIFISPAISTENLYFYQVLSKKYLQPDAKHHTPTLDYMERHVQQGEIEVPVKTLKDDTSFKQWLNDMHKQGYHMSGIAMIACKLMPELTPDGKRIAKDTGRGS
ncbi:MAG: hypothetical protein ACKO37_03075 [Vampirovibrionales bacterium]